MQQPVKDKEKFDQKCAVLKVNTDKNLILQTSDAASNLYL